MRKNVFIKILSVGLVSATLFIANVTPTLAEEKKAEQQQSQKGDFARGAKLWSETCASCHNMRDPKDLDDDAWEVVVAHMRLRAGLTGQDARDILEFLKKSN